MLCDGLGGVDVGRLDEQEVAVVRRHVEDRDVALRHQRRDQADHARDLVGERPQMQLKGDPPVRSVLDMSNVRRLVKGRAAPPIHDERHLVLVLSEREETRCLPPAAEHGLQQRPCATLERAGRDTGDVQLVLVQRDREILRRQHVLHGAGAWSCARAGAGTWRARSSSVQVRRETTRAALSLRVRWFLHFRRCA